MLHHRYTENYKDIPFSEISRKLNACTLQCVPGVPPRPSSKLELERLGTRLPWKMFHYSPKKEALKLTKTKRHEMDVL